MYTPPYVIPVPECAFGGLGKGDCKVQCPQGPTPDQWGPDCRPVCEPVGAVNEHGCVCKPRSPGVGEADRECRRCCGVGSTYWECPGAGGEHGGGGGGGGPLPEISTEKVLSFVKRYWLYIIGGLIALLILRKLMD